MALGYYTNWSDHETTAGYSIFRPPSPELPPELFFFNEPPTLYDNYNINQLFDHPNYNNSNNNNKTLDYFPAYNSEVLPPAAAAAAGGHVVTPSPEFQVATFNQWRSHLITKGQNPGSTPVFNHHYHHHLSHFLTMELEHPMTVAPPPLQPPEAYSWYGGGGGGGGDKVEGRRDVEVVRKQKVAVGGGGGGGVVRLSAQSMAARVRRRKISEKTQELGKLIPGGRRMNTAEMFQAAFKYIKFLQAQVGVLKLMDSIPEGEQVLGNEELMEALVTCTSMQEKLYTAEKCIVSKHFAETLAIN